MLDRIFQAESLTEHEFNHRGSKGSVEKAGRGAAAGLRDCSSGIGNCPARWSRSPAHGI